MNDKPNCLLGNVFKLNDDIYISIRISESHGEQNIFIKSVETSTFIFAVSLKKLEKTKKLNFDIDDVLIKNHLQVIGKIFPNIKSVSIYSDTDELFLRKMNIKKKINKIFRHIPYENIIIYENAL